MTGSRQAEFDFINTVAPASSTPTQFPGLTEGPSWGFRSPPVVLIFRDAQARRWVRWLDGKLTRMAPCLVQLTPVDSYREGCIQLVALDTRDEESD